MRDILRNINVLGQALILFFYVVGGAVVAVDAVKKRDLIYWAILVLVVSNILDRLGAGAFVQFIMDHDAPEQFIMAGLWYGAATTVLHILALIFLVFALVKEK